MRALADAKRTATRIEILPTVIYVGYAEYLTNGTVAPADSDTQWTIKKITLTNGSPTAIEWTQVGAGSWTNRATEAYE